MAGLAAPFLLVGQSALATLEAMLSGPLSGWAADWGIASSQIALAVARASDGEGVGMPGHTGAPQWRRQVQAGNCTVWLACDSGTMALQKAIFGAPFAVAASSAPAGLAAAGADEALGELLGALTRAALGMPSEIRGSDDGRVDNCADGVPAHVWKRGSGAALATVTIEHWSCSVLLDGTALAALLPRAAALPGLGAVDYGACMAQVPVALELVAGGARVSLGSLLALSEGDVIGLGNRSDAPLTLRSPAGRSVLNGYLGRRGETIAIELSTHEFHHIGD